MIIDAMHYNLESTSTRYMDSDLRSMNRTDTWILSDRQIKRRRRRRRRKASECIKKCMAVLHTEHELVSNYSIVTRYVKE